MKKILVSGLINTETTVKIKEFPISYFPIDYPFFGVNTRVSGVAYNVAKALSTLGDHVVFTSMTGKDFGSQYIHTTLKESGVSTEHIQQVLQATPSSVVLYDEEGRRQVYCDLKDIQDCSMEFPLEMYEDCDIVVACNVNFNRSLLSAAKKTGKIIASDVHVLRDINDEYNQDFMSHANILFLSDEGIETDYREFLLSIEEKFHNDIIVLGMGKKGALMYVKADAKFYELPACVAPKVVNTVGAGDSLFSSFVHYYAKGLTPQECLKRAQAFAAYKIGFDGASEGFATEATVEEMI